ncbi:MAG: exosome complex RNA-binding protein Rrp4 [Nanoarchaeota archaeon]
MSTNINGSGEASEENYSTEESGSAKRRIVVPGETIIEGEDYLPGEGTRREGLKIVSSKFGLAEEAGRLIKIISIFGAFVPRKGNVVVGRVTDLNYAGWVVDIDCAAAGFLPIEESPRFINRNEMDQYLKIGDVIAAKIWTVKTKGPDLTLNGKGLGKLEGGFIFRIIPSRVPRVIGKEGSMVGLIKEKTNCSITVGQNGWVWIKGQSIDEEIKARKAIEIISEKVHVEGLTEKMESWFEEK